MTKCTVCGEEFVSSDKDTQTVCIKCRGYAAAKAGEQLINPFRVDSDEASAWDDGCAEYDCDREYDQSAVVLTEAVTLTGDMRRVYKIDCGSMPPAEANAFIAEVTHQFNAKGN